MLSVFDHQVISFLLDFIELNLHENDVEVFLRDWDDLGKTTFIHAWYHGCTETLEFLLEYKDGIYEQEFLLNQGCREQGGTALMYALDQGCLASAGFLMDFVRQKNGGQRGELHQYVVSVKEYLQMQDLNART